VVDERHRGGTAGQGLDPQCPGTGKQVGHPEPVHSAEAEQDVEHRFAYPVGGGPHLCASRRHQAPAPELATDNTHPTTVPGGTEFQ
jgi:hypothetical protein